MSLPGFALPGLISSTLTQTAAQSNVLAPPRTEELPPRTELRFEAAIAKPYKIRLTRGNAEIFGVELALNVTYTFVGTKGAVFTWQGCSLELQGDAESEYVGSETDSMVEWINVHGMIETFANDSAGKEEGGPRVLVLGPDSSGKSSFVKCLTSWAVRSGRTPTVVNTDSREAMLSVPGSLEAVTHNTVPDVEDWGMSAISGPSSVPVKTPLVYHYPFSSPDDDPALFKSLTGRVALAVTSRMEQDATAKQSGLIIDTPGSLNNPRNQYELANHLISEFSINLILVLGSERWYNDLSRRYSAPKQQQPGEDPIPVLRIAVPPGVVARDETFLRAIRARQVRNYLFGDARTPLNPHSQMWDFSDLAIWKMRDPHDSGAAGTASTSLSFLPGMDDDDEDDYDPAGSGSTPAKNYNGSANGPQQGFERVQPSQGMVHSVLAIKFAPGNASADVIRDSCVIGFVYVADVDEVKKKVRFLTPQPTRWADRALVWGPWPEGVGDIVA